MHIQTLAYHISSSVEVPIINHSRDYAPNLEKYEAVQIYPVEEDRN